MTHSTTPAHSDALKREQIEQWLEGARDPQGHPGWHPQTNGEIAALCELALRAPPPSNERVVALWCAELLVHIKSRIGAVDGYSYESGREYGLREGEIAIRTYAATLPQPSSSGNEESK